MNIENFGKDNETINNINYDANASFESNTRVNTSMMVESLTNIINNAVNDVKQTNSAEASSFSSATNTISINNMTGKNFNLIGVNQNADAKATVDVDAEQKNVSTIVNAMESSIQKQITKESNISNIINEINDDNQKALQASIDAIPPIPNVPKPAANDHISSLFGVGNKTTNNINTTYESSVKKMLNIDDSFKVSDNNNIKNDLFNYITNANYAKCQADANAMNQIALNNMQIAGDVNIRSIQQTSKAETNLKCAFTQTNISNIANKIVNQISTTINNLYKGIQNKSVDPSKYDFLHNLGAAISDKAIGASGINPHGTQLSDTQTQEQSKQAEEQSKQAAEQSKQAAEQSKQAAEQKQLEQQKQVEQQNQSNQLNQLSNTNIIIYIFVGIIVLLLIIMLIFIMTKK